MSTAAPHYFSPHATVHDRDKADEIRAKLADFVAESMGDDTVLIENDALIAHITGHSPFLAKLIERDPAYFLRVLSEDGGALLHEELKQLSERPTGETTEQLMHVLRLAKARVSLLTAVMDISCRWSLFGVTKALSDFASAALDIATAHALHKRMISGEIAWPRESEEPVTPTIAEKTGFVVLGLGKLGADELNYSSDIDLIVLYDELVIDYLGRRSPQDCFVKVTQDIVKLMDKRTMDGYVFRTDLRLRPDPSATPIALSMLAAESYYHSLAQNWERSAMIKARPVAGDKAAGDAFLERMTSWVWRRSMDYEALKDIHAIKNQILRHYNQLDCPLKGYDVKLGEGGIREIEFYAQVNQLVCGGRDVSLRSKQTIKALDSVVEAELMSASVRDDLRDAYEYLRRLEHRLQMVSDEQTHKIPKDDNGLKRIASFMGAESIDTFEEELRHHTNKVREHYDALMPLEEGEAPLLTGDALRYRLDSLKFDNVDEAFKLIESWSLGRYKSLKTARARELLHQCLNGLITAFGEADEPMRALIRFDRFIEALPSGVQVFSLFQSNPRLFALIARILSVAPALADQLAKRPTLWEAVLDPGFFEPMPNIKDLKSHLRKALKAARDYQDILDITRRWVAEHRFQVGVQLLEGLSDVDEAGLAMTRIADATLQEMMPHVEAEFAKKYGTFEGGGLCVLAMGKYGGKELTYTSDLDVVLLYHVEDFDSVSNGTKPLQPSQYFSRLGQSFVTAVTALTAEGRLFDLDTRLRPSGSSGPMVVTLRTFKDYYQDPERAWTWEHMALTRARIILSPKGMKAPLLDTIHSTLSERRDHDHLLEKVAEMRQKLDDQFGTDNPFSSKFVRGGLVDMEFIAQYLMLKHGADDEGVFSPILDESYEALVDNGYLDRKIADEIMEAHHLQQTVQSLLRLCLGSSSKGMDTHSNALKEVLLKASKMESYDMLKNTLIRSEERVFEHYNSIIQIPYKNQLIKEES